MDYNQLQVTKSFPLSFERPKESLAKKSRPLPYNCLKIGRQGCKNLTPRPTEEHCRASSNRNSCCAMAPNFLTAIIRRRVVLHIIKLSVFVHVYGTVLIYHNVLVSICFILKKRFLIDEFKKTEICKFA